MYIHILNLRLCSNNTIKSHLEFIVLFVGNIRMAKYSSTYNTDPICTYNQEEKLYYDSDKPPLQSLSEGATPTG